MRLTADRVVTWNDETAPAGVTVERVYLGPDPHRLGGFQVAVASATIQPSRQTLRDLFAARKGKTQIQLVVAVTHEGTTHIFGPDPQAQAIQLAVGQAERQLQSVLSEPDVLAATERFAGFRKAGDSTGVPGFTNSGLFASHHITSNVPKRSDWATLGNKALPLLGLRTKPLIEALGFITHPGPNGTLLLTTGGLAPRAVAVLLEDTEHFDAKTSRFQLSPVAFGLAIASRQEVPWLVVLRKDQIRLYPGRDGVGVGSKGQAETFFEVDLSTVDTEYAALLPLIFSAGALAAEGTADELLRDSSRYATELGARLRERIYDEIVPPLAVEVAQRLVKHAALTLDADGLSTAYRVTLRILFRLLFQAYAEDRGLLPSGRNEGFDANSLKTNARRLIDSDSDAFGDASTIWLDLVQVWNAIDQGNPQWQIPSYNGGLFSIDPERSPEGALIKVIELPDSVLGPALKSLLIDINNDGVLGPVDFRSLSVREFGTIYEGLLESSLSLADQDLTIDSSGAWVPADDEDDIDATSGSVYFHTASGERKATGSYFTPKIVVDHLIERSIVPALSAHLEKIANYLAKGDGVAAARDFFDFRVADLAMGSGHFLVAAVDKIEALMRTFLTEHTVPGVTDELLRLAGVAKDALGTDDVAKSEVDEIGLLRRQIARRCIYGLDINPMAVELARLALWIHTFVPGLPMSNLDHGLVNANSLTGIGTINEAVDALVGASQSFSAASAVGPGLGGRDGLFDNAVTLFDEPSPSLSKATGYQQWLRGVVTDYLEQARPFLVDVANASEGTKAEVQQAVEMLGKAREAAEPARKIFDAAVAIRLGKWSTSITRPEHISRLTDTDAPGAVVAPLRPAHMPFLFPEVFLRPNPGFDILLGNPPWEKAKVETTRWWALRFPGLRSLPQGEQDALVAQYRTTYPMIAADFDTEVEMNAAVRKLLLRGPYPGIGKGDPDLYLAFAWRNKHLLRSTGRAGIVVPRSLISEAAGSKWRSAVFETGEFADVTIIVNSGRWAFDIHPQWTVALLTIEGARTAGEVRLAGPYHSQDEFTAGEGEARSVFPADEFRTWGTDGAFPMLPSTASGEVFLRMHQHPRLDFTGGTWRARPYAELHASSDKPFMDLSQTGVGSGWPVYKGESFDLWEPDTGIYYARCDPDQVLPELHRRRQRPASNSPFREFDQAVWSDRNTLPCLFPRIAMRLVSRATDTRTVRAALVPPKTVLAHGAPYLLFPHGGSTDVAYLIGVMSSIPFDWNARRVVELNLTYGPLNSFPVPRPLESNPLQLRTIEIAGRLSAVDARYSKWATEVGVPVGSVTTAAEKDDLIAELDAVVSLLYGLNEDQVEHVFATFHRGWNYEPRLEVVLKYYRQWKGNS